MRDTNTNFEELHEYRQDNLREYILGSAKIHEATKSGPVRLALNPPLKELGSNWAKLFPLWTGNPDIIWTAGFNARMR